MVYIPGLKELWTVWKVLEGKSLARFGDGELLILSSQDSRTQAWSKKLEDELRHVLHNSECVVGVPHDRGVRSDYWKSFLSAYQCWYGEKASSFISRPDEVPMVGQAGFQLFIKQIWKDRDVTLVGSGSSLTRDHMEGAKSVTLVNIPDQNAYSHIDDIEDMIGEPKLTILCAGPTATCLANRLTRKGLWAVDLGYAGRFM